jgi:hypothetical protein
MKDFIFMGSPLDDGWFGAALKRFRARFQVMRIREKAEYGGQYDIDRQNPPRYAQPMQDQSALLECAKRDEHAQGGSDWRFEKRRLPQLIQCAKQDQRNGHQVEA